MRQRIRSELVAIVGGAHEAFRILDLSRSGRVSFQEFSDGLSRLGIDWQEHTGLTKSRDLFKLFDLDKDGVLTMMELFPESQGGPAASLRVSTPDFWNNYCRSTANSSQGRNPQWSNASKEEELRSLFDAAQLRQDVTDKRKWMSSTIRRMKHQGKSDGRCREICARHLPRGTGPKDADDVHMFSDMEVKSCRRKYTEKVNQPARNIQKIVYEMREQRKVLQTSRQKMSNLTTRNYEVHRTTLANALGGILHLPSRSGEEEESDD
jgi:Ca2+-binding EF-hand superfamily protein